MTETFQCPACGAPLTVSSNAATIHCPYCNNAVIVPETIRGNTPQPAPVNSTVDPARIQEMVAIARSGNKIEAIKRYRQLTDVGLKEAKDAIEALMEGRPVAIPVSQTAAVGVGEDIVALVRSGKKIEAIKRYRELNNVGLKEAKDAVEAMQAANTWGNIVADQSPAISFSSMPAQPSANLNEPSRSAGCLVNFLVAIIVLAILLGCLTPFLLFFFNPGG